MKILIGALLLLSVMAMHHPEYDRLYRDAKTKSLEQEQYWFDQVRDHYNYDAT
jgi:hypothetical protein